MMLNYGFLLDSMIVVLLVATIVYAAILNRRLQTLRNNRSELEQAARAFAESASRADEAIKALRTVSDGAGADLREQIHRAQALRDEMKFLVEAGEGLADRLEGVATAAIDGRKDGAASRSRPASQAEGAASGKRRDGQVTPLRTRANNLNDDNRVRDAQGDGGRSNGSPGQSAEGTNRRPAPRGRGDVDLLKAIESMR